MTAEPAGGDCSRAAARVRRTKAQQRAETVEHILDAAEYLFSRQGLHGVRLRDVAERVGVHCTLLHYYFEDKRSLFEAVFARRAATTTARRMEALERYQREAGEKPTVEGALHALLDTDLDLFSQGGEAWMNYGAFCARIANTPEGAALMDAHFEPVVRKLFSILKTAMPAIQPADIYWGFHFVIGSLWNTLARTRRIDHMSAGLCRSDDFAAVKQRMARFMAGGFLALHEPPEA